MTKQLRKKRQKIDDFKWETSSASMQDNAASPKSLTRGGWTQKITGLKHLFLCAAASQHPCLPARKVLGKIWTI